jgi:hypothetical protein
MVKVKISIKNKNLKIMKIMKIHLKFQTIANILVV